MGVICFSPYHHRHRDGSSFLTSFAVSLDQVGWRCLVPAERLRHIPDLPLTNTSWWYGKAKSLWLSPVDADLSNLTDIEFTARVFNEPPVPGETVSWGRRVSNEKVFSRFSVSLAPRNLPDEKAFDAFRC